MYGFRQHGCLGVVTQQSRTRVLTGSASGVSKAKCLVRTMAKPGWPEHQHGPFLGCRHPTSEPNMSPPPAREGHEPISGPLLSWLECAGWATALLLSKPCSPGPFCLLFPGPAPAWCSRAQRRQGTAASLAHQPSIPKSAASESADCSWDKETF